MSSYATHQISKLTAVLQPIVSVQRGRILGFEALCRHRESMPGSSPAFIFEQAITQGWRPELEYACLHNACAAFRNSKEHFESSLLFINVDAQVVSQDEFYFDELYTAVRTHGIDPKRVVIELSEQAVEDVEALSTFCNRARAHEFLIALDDVGIAHANFERILAIRPTILKLDICLISDLSHDSWKREVVRGLVRLAQRIGSLVLAEGVEKPDDIMVALELGVDLFQGFYFAKPGHLLSDGSTLDKRLTELRKNFSTHRLDNAQTARSRREWMEKYVRKLSTDLLSIHTDQRAAFILDELERNPRVECIYSLDPQGIQISETFHRVECEWSESPLFQPARIGNDHSLKPYCLPLLSGAHQYISAPYLSWASGLTCVTVCIRAIDVYDHFLLCVDFRF